MTNKKHGWAASAAIALLAGASTVSHAQATPDAHAGHHPAEAVAATTASPPSAPAAKAEGMMSGMGAEGGKPMMGMMDGKPMHCMADGMPMAGDIEKRIAALRSQLHISTAQAGAWDAFAGVLRADSRNLGQFHAGMMKRSAGMPSLSLAQRLDRHDRMLAAARDNIRALKPALARLYAGLSAEQKDKAETLLAHDVMMASMPMPGMPMSGMPMGEMMKK